MVEAGRSLPEDGHPSGRLRNSSAKRLLRQSSPAYGAPVLGQLGALSIASSSGNPTATATGPVDVPLADDRTTYVSHTAVRFNADGTQDVKTTRITVAQQKEARMLPNRLSPPGTVRFHRLSDLGMRAATRPGHDGAK